MLFVKKATTGYVLIRTHPLSGFWNSILGNPIDVSFRSFIFCPFLHKIDVYDVSMKSISIEIISDHPLVCLDDTRITGSVNFLIRINQTKEDVLKARSILDAFQSGSEKELLKIFGGSFKEALHTEAMNFKFKDFYDSSRELKESIFEHLEANLSGFLIEDVSFDRVRKLNE